MNNQNHHLKSIGELSGDVIADAFARMLAKVDDEANDSPSEVHHEEKPKPAPSLVRASNGWDDRFIEEVALKGDRWLETFGKAKDVIADGGIAIFYGNRGAGKTRMAAEIARSGQWATDAGQWNGYRTVYGKTAIYRRAASIFLELRAAGTHGSNVTQASLIQRLKEVGLLVIDEFQERSESEWENSTLTSIIDQRYGPRRPTILIANYDKAQLVAALGASISSRMNEKGKAFAFDWEDFRREKSKNH